MNAPSAEKETVRRAAAGDPAAFEALMRSHEATVAGRLRRRLRNPEDVEDARCEVFARAWRGLRSLRSTDRLGSWLCTIADRVAGELRAERDRQDKVLAYLGQAAARPVARSDPRVDVVHEALSCLSDDARALLDMAAEGRSANDLASALGASPGAARARLHRARRSLQKEVDRIMGQEPKKAERTVMSGLGNLLKALGNVGEAIDDIDPGEVAKWQRCIEGHLEGGRCESNDELFVHFSVRDGKWSMRMVNMHPAFPRIGGVHLRSAAIDVCRFLSDERVLRALAALQAGSMTPAAVRRRARIRAGEWDEVRGKLQAWSAIEEEGDRLRATEQGIAIMREAFVLGLKCADLRRAGRRYGEVPKPAGR